MEPATRMDGKVRPSAPSNQSFVGLSKYYSQMKMRRGGRVCEEEEREVSNFLGRSAVSRLD